MNVKLIAHTILVEDGHKVLPFLEEDYETTDLDHLGELAGRACYGSFDRPNPDTRENKDYLANIIRQGHFSVLAHASATFYISGASRSLTHELIRHRFLAFSEISQRYVDMEHSYTVIPPDLRYDWGLEELIRDHHARSLDLYDRVYDALQAQGKTRKEARQAARAVLPGGTNTNIVVSGNFRAFRDFIQQRDSDGADREIRELAREVKRQLKGIAPNSFQDL